MLAPGFLYNFESPVHEGSRPLTIQLVPSRSTSSAATAVTHTLFTVPADFVLLLTNATMRATPGAGQAVTGAGVQVVLATSGAVVDITRSNGGAADAQIRVNWAGEVWCPPGSVVRGQANFDAAVAANIVAAAMHGVLIPRGTISIDLS